MTDKPGYYVVDDFGQGDDWSTHPFAFGPFETQEQADDKAEAENFHSASIVLVNDDGGRERCS